MLEINECQLEFIDDSPPSRDLYIQSVQCAVVGEALELEKTLHPKAKILGVLFLMLHDEMHRKLKRSGRKERRAALSFWKEQNDNPGMISP